MLQGPAKTRLLNATSVPLPKRQFGPAKQRKESMLKSTAAHNCKYWVENAPTFRIPGVNINQLSERSKPSKADKAHSAQIMEEMEDWEPNAFSAKYTDEDGNLLAAYFSNRVITPNKPRNTFYIGSPRAPSQHGCSLYDLKRAKNNDSVKLAFDGIPVSVSCDLKSHTHNSHSPIL